MQLVELEAGLADKRSQLDRVAAMVLARQRDLEYEAHKAALTAEGAVPPHSDTHALWLPCIPSLSAFSAAPLSTRLLHLLYPPPPPLLVPPERSLLELRRSQMERIVSDQVAEEGSALRATLAAAMRADVERQVAQEGAALAESLRKAAAQVRGGGRRGGRRTERAPALC